MRAIQRFLILLGIVLAPAAAARGADPALDMWRTQRQNIENFVRHMKPLGKHRIQDVMEIRIQKKFLVLMTRLPSMPEEAMQAKFDGMSGSAWVAVLNEQNRGSAIDHAAGEAAEPQRFSLNIVDYPAPKQTSSIGVNSTAHNQITISRTVQIMNGPFHQVIVTQQRPMQSTGPGMVQLIVTDSQGAGTAAQQFNRDAPDFFTFVRQYPQETGDYIRPLLRDLGQESVFAPEPMVAWQIFSELWKPDPKVSRQVQELLPLLNAEDYRTRDSALVKLQRLGRDGAAVLMHLDRSRLSPEQNARVDLALLPYAQLPTKEIARLRSDPGFLLDCLYSDEAPVRRAALERLRVIARPDLQFDVDADAAARGAAVAALRRQILPPPPATQPK